MKKFVSILATVLVAVCMMGVFTGCRQSDRVSYNISKEADNFNVVRRLVVINGRTDKPVFECIGVFSYEIEQENGVRSLAIIVQTGPNEYKKHRTGLPEEAFWNVEDISGADVSSYRYEVNFLPEMIWPLEITSTDNTYTGNPYPNETNTFENESEEKDG